MSNTRIVAVGRLVGRAYSRSRKIKWTMQRTHPKWRQAVREHSVEVIKLSNVPPPAPGRARAPSLSLCERKPKTDEAVTLVRSLARSLSRRPLVLFLLGRKLFHHPLHLPSQTSSSKRMSCRGYLHYILRVLSSCISCPDPLSGSSCTTVILIHQGLRPASFAPPFLT